MLPPVGCRVCRNPRKRAGAWVTAEGCEEFFQKWKKVYKGEAFRTQLGIKPAEPVGSSQWAGEGAE